MLDASLQPIAALGGMLLGLLTLIGAWTYWLIRNVERQIRDVARRLGDRIDRNHRELLALLGNHTHGDGTPPVFHRLPDAAGD